MSGISEQDIEHIAPLSGLQQSMLFRSLAEPNSGHYIEQLSYELSNFDLVAMQAALDAIIATRSAMRTSFLWREQATPKRLTFGAVKHVIEHKEIGSLGVMQLSEQEKRDAIATDRARGLTLSQAPLMRMTVLTPSGALQNYPEVTAFCIWTFHHAVVDGWSIALLQQELLSYYDEYRSGKTPTWSATDSAGLGIQNNSQESNGLWDQQLRHANRDSALAFLPGPAAKERAYAETKYCSDSDLAVSVQSACQKHRVTFANFANAAWSLLLCHLNGHNSTLYGTIDSGRSNLKGGESAVGMFMQLLPVCIDVDESLPLSKFLQGIQRSQWALQTDKLPSPADIALALERAPGDELFDTLLLVQNYPAAEMPENIGLLEIEGFEQADAPLVLSVGNTNGLRMLARFQTDRLDAKQAYALQTHFANMLAVLAAATESQTLEELLDRFTTTNSSTSRVQQHCEISNERCIDRFSEMAQKHPKRVALFDSSRSYTYADLASRTEQIREHLAEAGITDHSTVAILQSRSVDSIASSLAVLAQGASYVPIDPGFPMATVESMLRDSDAQLVLGANAAEIPLSSLLIKVIPLPVATVEQKKLHLANSKNSNMCMMFTSGSTGKPKGIALTHAAVMNRLSWMERAYPFADDDIGAARTPVNFVDAVAEIFGPLCAGVSSRIINDEELSSLGEFIRIVEQAGVTRVGLVPSLLSAVLMELGKTGSWPSLRLCTVSGEALRPQLAADFHDLLPNSVLLNLYGSTEVAADALFYQASSETEYHREWVAIGKPIENMAAQACNAYGRALPRGVIGELQIQGLGVAAEYLHDTGLSAAKFVDGRFRSGDLAVEDEHGVFHYLGRADRQIKVRGQRVEPGAIESTLIMHSDVQQAVVLLIGQNLVCVYTGERLTHDILAEFVGSELPAYSLPSRYQHVEEIPLTHNGKVDYTRLQQIAADLPTTPREKSTASLLSLHQKELGLTIGNIWSELLPDAVISTDTDFFEAGGHSLLAMQMIAGVERALGFTVPLAVFMSNTRLADFAKVLFEGIPKLAAPELITLRDGNVASPALFCIQGDAYNIVAHCQTDRRIFWISQWSTCVDLTRDPVPVAIESIQETAERYAQHIQRAHPEGTLRILAACGAAVISIEVARILQSNGRTPEKLVLMDLPRGELTTASQRGFKHRQGRNLLHSAYGYMMRVWGGNKIKAHLDRRRINRKVVRGIALSDAEAVELMHIRLSDALERYQPCAYAGPVELVFSKSWYRGVDKVENAFVPTFWKPYFSQVTDIHFSPAKVHAELLQDKAAAFAANILESDQ
ncbi:MAG: AMP-binding protein [Pseudomonadota bacterium]